MSSDHPPADALQLLDALERCVEIREEFRPRLSGLCMVKRFYPEKEFSGQDLDLWVFAVGNFFEQWIEGRLDVWGRRDGSLGWSLIPHDFAIYVDPQSVDWYPGHISLPNGETVYCIRVAPATTVDTVSADQLNGRSRRRNLQDDASLKNKLETVIKNATQSWPNKQKRPPISAMVKELIRQSKAQGYDGDTLRKILSGTYKPAKRLGIRLDW
jgi:hypothetical protein